MRNGTLYIGVTSDLVRRVHQHKAECTGGFTKEYGVKALVYFEVFDSIENAISREKQLKNWLRDWKIQRIEINNPNWDDIYASLL